MRNKAQVFVFAALKEIRENLPFPLLGIDSDNGSEFINKYLVEYCDKQKLSFTRSRPYRKNDNCFVEQKNYSIVRRAVGYQRYDTEVQLGLLNELYATQRLYTNFFQPTMKLKSKERVGSKVIKRYHRAQTPYQDVLNLRVRRDQFLYVQSFHPTKNWEFFFRVQHYRVTTLHTKQDG